MKALLFFCMFTMSLVQSRGQSKEILYEYYSFKSTCFFLYTENESCILTLYKDRSFLFEVFLNKYSAQVICTRSSYIGLWTADKEVFILKFLNNGMESIAEKTFKTRLPPNKFVLSAMPVKCRIESENLITDSKVLPNMNIAKSKIMALSEKKRFDNYMTSTSNQKIKFSSLSIKDIKNN